MQHKVDVAIVGGGVIGCAIAYYLSKSGVDVSIFDRGEIGAEASSAATGLLAPLGPLSGPGPFADLLLSSFALFPALVPELEEASGIHLAYKQTGALRIVRNPKHVSNLRKRMHAWQPLGLKMHWLTGDEARQLEPLLSPDLCAAIYVPEESQIDASSLVKSLSLAAINQGASFYSHSKIIGIEQHKTKVTGVYTSLGDKIACNHLVIANGAWAAECGEWLHFPIPIIPQRGQALMLHQPPAPLRHIIFGEAAYLAPKMKHKIIVGATKEDAGFDANTTPGGLSWLLNAATRLSPALERLLLRAHVGRFTPQDTRQSTYIGTSTTLGERHSCCRPWKCRHHAQRNHWSNDCRIDTHRANAADVAAVWFDAILITNSGETKRNASNILNSHLSSRSLLSF